MQEEFAGRVDVVGVASGGDLAEFEEFVAATGVGGFTHVADERTEIWAAYGVSSQPKFAFIDDDGTVEVTRIDIADLRERIVDLHAT